MGDRIVDAYAQYNIKRAAVEAVWRILLDRFGLERPNGASVRVLDRTVDGMIGEMANWIHVDAATAPVDVAVDMIDKLTVHLDVAILAIHSAVEAYDTANLETLHRFENHNPQVDG